jgi:RNA-directed DNA polymerase
VATVSHEVPRSYPGRPPGLRSGKAASGNWSGRKDETVKGREESDGRVVPESRRKSAVTGRRDARGGKATTASQQARQLELPFGTAESPRGDDGGAGRDRFLPVTCAVPKPRVMTRGALPAMEMEEVAREENLEAAFEAVAANNGAPGPNRQSIAEVREHLGEIVSALAKELLAGSYRPGMIRRVWIPKPGGGQRGLGIPDVVDRMVQQAVYQVMSPHWEPTFHGSSHGFRPGRSCHTAIAEAVKYVEDGYEWVVDLDLEKFFDRVHHERLLARVGRRVKDHRLVQLIRRMLKAKVVMPDGVVVSNEEGTPQGGPLSPLLSNIVLDELDWELARRGHRFVRYADDCNIYVRSCRSGERVMASISRFIERKLRLKVNVAKSAVARPEERHFLGFRLRREPEGGDVEVLLSQRSRDRIAAKIRELTPRSWGQSLAECIRRLNAYVGGWVEFFRIVTKAEERTLSTLDAHIRRRLRAIILRHWKRKRTIAVRLIRLGTRPKTAWRSVYRGKQRRWALSHCTAVDRGLRNVYFTERGLVSLLQRWRALQPRDPIAPRQLWLPFGIAAGGNAGAGLQAHA